MKLTLNEDLFVEPVLDIEMPIPDVISDMPEVIDETPKGPATGADTGIANQIIDMINGEWDTIKKYNELVTNLTEYGYSQFVSEIQDILNEENIHVGQLQAILKEISPNAESIEAGELEATNESLNESSRTKINRYSIHEDDDGSVTIQRVAPYDDAEYVWARSVDPEEPFKFYYNGKEIPGDIYAEKDDFSDIVDILEDLNKDIEPIMVHN